MDTSEQPVMLLSSERYACLFSHAALHDLQKFPLKFHKFTSLLPLPPPFFFFYCKAPSLLLQPIKSVRGY